MQTKALLEAVLTELDDVKAINVTPLDVRQFTPITDYMVIATGNSSRHVNAIAEKLVKNMKEQDIPLHGIEGDKENEWVLVDLGDIVVHIMQQRARDFYQIEKLWAPRRTAAMAFSV